jgi:hypothetical protein
MTEAPRGRADAAAAGALLIAAILGCAAAGYGLGSLAGLAVPVGLMGLFVGLESRIALPSVAGRLLASRTARLPGSLVVGLALVYARFKQL